MPETPRFALLVKGDVEEASKAAGLFGVRLGAVGVRAAGAKFCDFLRDYWAVLIGTTLPWLLMDVALYGTGVYSGQLASAIMGRASSLSGAILEQGIPFLVGFPGYFAAALTIDRLGRRPLQIAGFAAMSALYLAASAALGLGLAGPRDILPQLLLHKLRPQHHHLRPARRAVLHALPGHGISAAAGKLGAALAAMCFPALMADMGVPRMLHGRGQRGRPPDIPLLLGGAQGPQLVKVVSREGLAAPSSSS